MYKMSTLTHLFDLPDQICYVQCGFCTTILLVSVPCSSLSMVVTVRCGHCTSLLSVNMMKVSFVPLHLLASPGHDDDQQKEQLNPEEVDGGKGIDTQSSLMVMTSSDNEEDHDQINPAVNRVINKPPEKRQRAPSAYNQFIKQEIRRLKAEHPNMAHKEAFSTAAKNWAHFPPINHREGESSITGFDEENGNWNFDAAEINIKSKGSCHERKVPRHSILAKTPFEY